MENKHHQHLHSHNNQGSPGFSSLRRFILFLIFVIIGYYLIMEHRAHVVGIFADFHWWIFLFLLALLILLCLLMHLFHRHGNHREQHSYHKKEDKNSSEGED